MFTPLQSVNINQNTTDFCVFPTGSIFWLILSSLFGMYSVIDFESGHNILWPKIILNTILYATKSGSRVNISGNLHNLMDGLPLNLTGGFLSEFEI